MGQGTPRRQTDQLSTTGRYFSSLRGNDQTSQTHSHGNYVHGDQDGCFLQHLNESELHSLIGQLGNTAGYNLRE